MMSSLDHILSNLAKESGVVVESVWDEDQKVWDTKVWIDGVKTSEHGDTFTDSVKHALMAHIVDA
jgi:hypothetical protein